LWALVKAAQNFLKPDCGKGALFSASMARYFSIQASSLLSKLLKLVSICDIPEVAVCAWVPYIASRQKKNTPNGLLHQLIERVVQRFACDKILIFRFCLGVQIGVAFSRIKNARIPAHPSVGESVTAERGESVKIRTSWIKYAVCLCWFLTVQSFSQTTHSPTSYLKEATISESAGTVRIVANTPRPLAQMLDALQKKYGWAVDYEDPQFLSKMDVIEIKETGKGPATSNLSQKLPAGGPFTIEFPSSAVSEEKILQLAVDSYNRSDNPGRFELRSAKQGAFFVVGIKARDTHDQIANQSAVFDELVTVANQQRNALDTVNLICQQIAAQRGIAVTLGVFPQRVLAAATVSVGGTKVAARDLLLQTLNLPRRSLYWRLLFDPNSKGYFLDIHLVPTS
jgi:hypothetical protein